MLRIAVVLTLSLIIHILMYEGVMFLPSSPRPSSELAIEVIEQIQESAKDPTENKFDKPVIENTHSHEAKDMNDPAQFMAEQNQRFEKQTKATKIGALQNQKAPSAKEVRKSATDGDIPEFARDLQNQMARFQEASVPYELPREIENGSATNLNADAHIYASFYNRVLNLFYVRWSERLDALFQRMPTDVYKNLSGKIWITEVEIWLNANGLYEKGIVMTSSGFKPFDEAGIFAFKSAKFFPNPPRAKVQEDGGHVRLKYRIGVRVR